MAFRSASKLCLCGLVGVSAVAEAEAGAEAGDKGETGGERGAMKGRAADCSGADMKERKRGKVRDLLPPLPPLFPSTPIMFGERGRSEPASISERMSAKLVFPPNRVRYS